MAKPIRNTPVLKGADADWFEKKINQPISHETIQANIKRMNEGVHSLVSFITQLNTKKTNV